MNCRPDDYPPYPDKEPMVKTLIGIAIALALLFAAAGTVAAHEVSNLEVRCQDKALHVEGILFGENLPIIVTVTGEQGYSESFEVTTADWSHNFPLPPNGHGQVDWPDSGDFGPVPFLVDCAAPRPTPSVVGHTPRPTPPQTDSYTVDARPMFDWMSLGVLSLVFLGITGLVERYLKTRR